MSERITEMEAARLANSRMAMELAEARHRLAFAEICIAHGMREGDKLGPDGSIVRGSDVWVKLHERDAVASVELELARTTIASLEDQVRDMHTLLAEARARVVELEAEVAGLRALP